MTGPGAARPLRPAPVLTSDNELFWRAAAGRKLVAQRCAGCDRLRHPPRPMCPHCHSLDWRETELSGRGTVYSYSVLHHPRHPLFDYPVIASLVSLDEGIRMLTNLVDVAPGDVAIGLRVELRWEPTADDMAVPVFSVLAQQDPDGAPG